MSRSTDQCIETVSPLFLLILANRSVNQSLKTVSGPQSCLSLHQQHMPINQSLIRPKKTV